jgi:arginyl-tRNA synthetase
MSVALETWSALKRRLANELRDAIQRAFGVDHEPVTELPPRRDLGDLAFPAGLHLARTLRQKPRAIAEALLPHFQPGPTVREVRVEGAGYLNVFLDRPAFAAALLALDPLAGDEPASGGKTIVEHTNINPNKAAHIGHLRNAVLGDVLVRALRALGRPVEVQNYIDDTGVQLADVVVGFMDLRRASPAGVAALPEPFDYLCWDLYAEVGRWYEEDPTRLALRRATLHELEAGEGLRAELGALVARRVVRRHLETMRRLGIGYDLLTHEADILRLDFFATAFERLKATGAVRLEEEGKNKGCWVMPLQESAEFAGLEDPDKVIVRSDGTVTYVGKDIAYQLWKFGLLGRDFGYRRWPEEAVWETTADPTASTGAPPFGSANQVINVIDARQSYLQKIVRAGLEALDHADAARRSVHFAYEMVTLSAAAAQALGYAGDKQLEMSGRRGIGVKADDLLDRVIAKSREELAGRDPEADEAALEERAREIMIGAVRYFMVKATTTRVIAFDFDEALNFEGESGPYLQYAAVRARNIQRKLAAAGLADRLSAEEVSALPAEHWSDDLWDLALDVARGGEVVERAAESLELSLLARHALELAQKFSAVYHRHPILQEENDALRSTRLAAVQVFLRGMESIAGVLGIPLPVRM